MYMKKLLIVVDMQKDFIDGSLGTAEAVSIVPAVKKKIEQYREKGQDIIFTLDTHRENYLDTSEGKHLPVVHCVKGTAGWELDSALSDCEGLRFEKPSFGSLELADYVRKGEYQEIELVGLCTDICVISNALILKAAIPEAKIAVDSACCAGVTPESHQNALEAMKMCQIEIK